MYMYTGKPPKAAASEKPKIILPLGAVTRRFYCIGHGQSEESDVCPKVRTN